jgi:chitin disaccharide deacetylase
MKRIDPGLIVNADDLGIHPSINDGIFSAHHYGIVSSATMLMTTPYLAETLCKIRRRALPIGIHLSLTLGKSVAGVHQVPDLARENDDFRWSSRQLLLCKFAGKKQALAAQIRRELEAQLNLALDYGLRPTHADSHQHVHMNPTIFAIVEELLPRYGIKRLRYSCEIASPRAVADLIRQRRYLNLAKLALLRALSGCVRPRLQTPDRFFGVLYSGLVTREALTTIIQRCSQRQSLEVCIHPGFPAPPKCAPYPVASENEFISSSARRMEHDLLVDPGISQLIRERKLILRGFDGRPKEK